MDDWKVGMIGASLGFGWCVTLLWMPSIADKKGRKWIYWFAMLGDLLLYTGLLITDHISVMIAIYFLFGMLSSIRIQVGFVYLMEVMPTSGQSLANSVWSVQETLIYTVAIVYFWKISKEWFWYCLIGYAW